MSAWAEVVGKCDSTLKDTSSAKSEDVISFLFLLFALLDRGVGTMVSTCVNDTSTY